ncbi:hypothetical protein PF005_g5383 [Phytophthora fragariae]|uniref:Uncharacterized protein n=1 Tax=Phytophthora fragariae TaxID=53985 RepID=A0A6A3T4S3_9STRA|nr:hypothetical protein PF009_g6213 [Phytophthora fragariae]KAE9021903.1 hypothetical protein PF011_g4711 [Phytophthora fragariae]KAE9126697.1 hypothetical protein PF007_g5872 [Phytophthora fragariae]KAE9128302.1 hypothetical protein PF010_g4546 [Phytophthora fragariae]KAE9150811.1 hypothetical protein PF006_g4832 [Phytophthora fragariae]
MGTLALGLLVLLWVAGSGLAVESSAGAGDEGPMATGVQPGAKVPIARTYRTAYGTHWDCSSTWMLLLGVHVVCVVGGFLLLSVIPVRFASNEKREAPFVLWFGSPKSESEVKVVDTPAEDEEEEKEEQHVTVEKEGEETKRLVGSVQTESVWQRVSAWVERTLAGLFVAPPARDIDARYRFHADMTQQLAAASAKTYESIAVSTDDLEVSWPSLHQTEEELPGGNEQPPRQPSVFVGAPPSPPAGARLRRQGSTRLSEASAAKAEAVGQRTSRASSGPGAVVTKDDFIRAASRRMSMAARAEKREALVQEDVSYENLGDDEIRMYEYLEFVRELLDGLGVKKVCQKSGRVVSRTLYITPDVTVVFWNTAGTFKRLTTKSSIQIENIQEVLRGIHGSRNVTATSTPERDALCVSIRCSDGKWLVLEAKSEAMRQRLFLGFSRLAQEKQEQEQDAAAAAAAPTEPTIPEVGEDGEAEEFVEREEKKMQLKEAESSVMQVVKSHTQVASTTYEAEVSVEGRVEQEADEQDIYEEKFPPPLPPMESRMSEVGEDEVAEEFVEKEEKQVQLKQAAPSAMEVTSTTYEAEVSVEGRVEQETDEQDVYEEKTPPPPLEDDQANFMA